MAPELQLLSLPWGGGPPAEGYPAFAGCAGRGMLHGIPGSLFSEPQGSGSVESASWCLGFCISWRRTCGQGIAGKVSLRRRLSSSQPCCINPGLGGEGTAPPGLPHPPSSVA